VTAVRVVIADQGVRDARSALAEGDCGRASTSAHRALSAVGTDPEGFEILGWCRMEAHRNAAAIDAMREAVRLDRNHWRFRYGLAIAEAAAGRDPRPNVRRARRLNPREQIFTNGVALKLARASGGWRHLVSGDARPSN